MLKDYIKIFVGYSGPYFEVFGGDILNFLFTGFGIAMCHFLIIQKEPQAWTI